MAGGGGMVGKAIRSSDIEKMSVDQHKSLKEQSDLEVHLPKDSVKNIRTAASRLEIASNTLHDLSLHPQGKKMLVPLTASLYVTGTLDDANRVLVDVGTGYLIKRENNGGRRRLLQSEDKLAEIQLMMSLLR